MAPHWKCGSRQRVAGSNPALSATRSLSSWRVDYGLAFLEKLRRTTELAWISPYLGLGWQPGTKWRGGMTDQEVDAAERQFGLRFPPDYQLFLQTLHTTDPECARYVDGSIQTLVGRPFFDWTGDPAPINEALAWPLDGLLFSVEAGESAWAPTWGKRPSSENERVRVVRELASQGPPLIPLSGHRYLVGSPSRSGNPVLSMYGADVIIYASSFGEWLANEIAAMLSSGVSLSLSGPEPNDDPIPFWQDVIDG
jgi:hypothetical protein